MSKPIKNLIATAYKKRFGDLDGAVLVDIRGLTSNNANKLRNGLAQSQIKVTVVKNSLARKAFQGTKLESLGQLLEGPSTMVYGGDSVVTVARKLLEALKDVENVQVKGAIMDGQLFGPKEVEALSKYPTRVEAQAQVVTLVLSPAKRVVGAVLSPGRKLASLIKAIADKKEKEGAAAPAA